MMATFIECALMNEPLPVNGDGEQSSDFIFIDDVIDACMKAPQESAIGKIIEIGTGKKTSVLEVAKKIIELTGSRFVVYTLGERFNREEFYDEFGKGSTFPQVTCNGQKLGGCVDTIKYLQEHKILT